MLLVGGPGRGAPPLAHQPPGFGDLRAHPGGDERRACTRNPRAVPAPAGPEDIPVTCIRKTKTDSRDVEGYPRSAKAGWPDTHRRGIGKPSRGVPDVASSHRDGTRPHLAAP